VRIALGMWLAANPVAPAVLSAADLHRLEGIVVYFGGLALVYQVAQRLDRHPPSPTASAGQAAWARSMAIPLAAYYAITIAVPLANGAEWSDAAFVRHAVVVLLVPLAAIALFAGAGLAFTAGQGIFTRRKPT
jgi:hypothetical protein